MLESGSKHLTWPTKTRPSQIPHIILLCTLCYRLDLSAWNLKTPSVNSAIWKCVSQLWAEKLYFFLRQFLLNFIETKQNPYFVVCVTVH